MPNSYVLSKPPPDQPVEDWLKWTRSGYERELSASLPTLAAIMGINKAGDIQYLFMPTIIPKAFASDDDSSAIIGNAINSHSKPSFIHTDTTDLGSVYVIDTYAIIPDEIRPDEPPPVQVFGGYVLCQRDRSYRYGPHSKCHAYFLWSAFDRRMHP